VETPPHRSIIRRVGAKSIQFASFPARDSKNQENDQPAKGSAKKAAHVIRGKGTPPSCGLLLGRAFHSTLPLGSQGELATLTGIPSKSFVRKVENLDAIVRFFRTMILPLAPACAVTMTRSSLAGLAEDLCRTEGDDSSAIPRAFIILGQGLTCHLQTLC